MFSTVGDIMINVGGYLEYRGCSVPWGISSVPWGISSVPWGVILSTVGDVQYRGGYHDARGGVQYHGGIPSFEI